MINKIILSEWNAYGVRHKIGELIDFLSRENIDIMIIGETKLTQDIKLKIKGYECLRKDNPNAEGGVLILIKNDVPYYEVDVPRTLRFDAVGIQLEDKTIVYGVYNSPRNRLSQRDLADVFRTGNKVIIVGDLNARHTSWNCHRNNGSGLELQSYTSRNNRVIMYPPNHTHYPWNGTTPTTIDLVVVKNVPSISDVEVKDDLNSDHHPILFAIGERTREREKKTILNYRTADWAKFREKLDASVKINNRIENTEILEEEVAKFTINIQDAIKSSIKIRKVKTTPEDDLPRTARDKIKQRNRIRKLWQRNRDPNLRPAINRLTKEIRETINTHKNQKWRDKLESLNPQDSSLWKITKQLKNKYSPIPALNETGKVAFTDEDKAEMLADQFEKVHRIELDRNTPEQQAIITQVEGFLQEARAPNDQEVEEHLTSPAEVRKTIKQCNPNKAPGPDGIQNKILRNLPRKSIVQLTYIINATLRHSYFPNSWKTATIVPIHKAGKINTSPASYRPISLLNTLGKLVEKIILERIKKHEKENNIALDCQFGFKEKHNTVQQVVRIANDVIKNFNKNKVTAMILLDIEKAFDTVWMQGLIYKLRKLHFPTGLINLINHYLTDRTFTVAVKQTKSAERRILAGVPQGSILGPKLFTIYLSDFPTSPRTNTALYADDTAVYAHSWSAIVAHKQLQIHCDQITKYFGKWKLKINASKTEVITFARKTNNVKTFQPIKINSEKATQKYSVKYLGVTLDSRLTLKPNINELVRKGSMALKNLYAIMCRRSWMSQENKKLLYITILRPIITYAAPVWCCAAKTNLKALQVFQNKCLRLILNEGRYARIRDLHAQAGLELIDSYVKELGQKFYATQLMHNQLLRRVTEVREHNTPNRIKHKYTYQELPIFHEP